METVIYWRDAIPLNESAITPSKEYVAAHYALMHLAHMREYMPQMLAEPMTKETTRVALSDHYDPAEAAFVAAALLMGWSLGRIRDVLEHDPQAAHEFAAQWVFEYSGMPERDVDSLLDTVTSSAIHAKDAPAESPA
jgi:hypothetical protein